MILSFVKDTETGEHAGAGGTFQVAELMIENTKGDSVVISELINQGTHFHSDDELRTYLADTMGTPAEHIHLSEV